MRDSRWPRGTCLAPGRWPLGDLLGLADVDDREGAVAVAVVAALVDVGGIDLGDLVLDLADELRAGRAHVNLLKGGRTSLASESIAGGLYAYVYPKNYRNGSKKAERGVPCCGGTPLVERISGGSGGKPCGGLAGSGGKPVEACTRSIGGGLICRHRVQTPCAELPCSPRCWPSTPCSSSAPCSPRASPRAWISATPPARASSSCSSRRSSRRCWPTTSSCAAASPRWSR